MIRKMHKILILVLILFCLIQKNYCLSPGMGTGTIYTEVDQLIKDKLIKEEGIKTPTITNHHIVGNFEQGVNALIYTNSDDKPEVLFVRSGTIVSLNPPVLLSDKIIESLHGCKVSETQLLIVYSAKDDNASDYNIYVSSVNTMGNILYKDILIDDFAGDQQFPKCLNTQNNDLFLIAWESQGQDFAGTSGIYAINLTVKQTGAVPEIIGESFQVNVQSEGDQKSPYMTLHNHAVSSTDPQYVIISWTGVGDYFDEDNDQYLLASDYENGTYGLGQLAASPKGFFRFFRFDTDRYVGYDDYYSLQEHFKADDDGSGNPVLIDYSNFKIESGTNNVIYLYCNSDDGQINIYSRKLDFETNSTKVITENNPLVCISTNVGHAQIIIQDDKLQLLSQKNGNMMGITLYFFHSTAPSDPSNCKPYYLGQGIHWQMISTDVTTNWPQLAFTNTSSGSTAAVFQISNVDNKIYFQEYFHEQGDGCQSTDKCDLCHLNFKGEELCTVCQGSNPDWRVIRKVNFSCPCKVDYLDITNQLDCEPDCFVQCQSCTLSPDNCTACTPGQPNRDTNAPCNCIDTYYSDDQQVCQLCQSPCVNCSALDVCTTCIVQANRNTNPPCTCLDTFYENSSKDCVPCEGFCVNCESRTRCLSCSDVNMVVTSTKNCVCKDNYFLNGLQVCESCVDATCKTCSAPNVCTSCLYDNSVLDEDTNQCSCKVGYYKPAGIDNCEKCDLQCGNCTTSASVCDYCAEATPPRDPNNSCACDIGYIDGSDGSCIQCNIRCLSCSEDRNKCDVCAVSDPPRIFDNNCQCEYGYMDGPNGTCIAISGGPTTELGTSENCLEGCATCLVPTSCLTCKRSLPKRDISNNCECPEGYRSVADSPNCESLSGGIDDSISEESKNGGSLIKDNDDGLFMVFVIIAICILVIMLCCIVVIIAYSKRKEKQKNKQDGKPIPLDVKLKYLQEQKKMMTQSNVNLLNDKKSQQQTLASQQNLTQQLQDQSQVNQTQFQDKSYIQSSNNLLNTRNSDKNIKNQDDINININNDIEQGLNGGQNLQNNDITDQYSAHVQKSENRLLSKRQEITQIHNETSFSKNMQKQEQIQEVENDINDKLLDIENVPSSNNNNKSEILKNDKIKNNNNNKIPVVPIVAAAGVAGVAGMAKKGKDNNKNKKEETDKEKNENKIEKKEENNELQKDKNIKKEEEDLKKDVKQNQKEEISENKVENKDQKEIENKEKIDNKLNNSQNKKIKKEEYKEIIQNNIDNKDNNNKKEIKVDKKRKSVIKGKKQDTKKFNLEEEKTENKDEKIENKDEKTENKDKKDEKIDKKDEKNEKIENKDEKTENKDKKDEKIENKDKKDEKIENKDKKDENKDKKDEKIDKKDEKIDKKDDKIDEKDKKIDKKEEKKENQNENSQNNNNILNDNQDKSKKIEEKTTDQQKNEIDEKAEVKVEDKQGEKTDVKKRKSVVKKKKTLVKEEKPETNKEVLPEKKEENIENKDEKQTNQEEIKEKLEIKEEIDQNMQENKKDLQENKEEQEKKEKDDSIPDQEKKLVKKKKKKKTKIIKDNDKLEKNEEENLVIKDEEIVENIQIEENLEKIEDSNQKQLQENQQIENDDIQEEIDIKEEDLEKGYEDKPKVQRTNKRKTTTKKKKKKK